MFFSGGGSVILLAASAEGARQRVTMACGRTERFSPLPGEAGVTDIFFPARFFPPQYRLPQSYEYQGRTAPGAPDETRQELTCPGARRIIRVNY